MATLTTTGEQRPTAAKLRQLYLIRKQSAPEIAAQYGVPAWKIRKWLLAAGITMRTRSEANQLAKPKISAALKGRKLVFTEEWKANISAAGLRWGEANAKGTRITPAGYVEYTRGPHKGRGVHAVLMEAAIGRALQPGEVVALLDGDRANNAIDNLELMTRSEHIRRQRAAQMDAGAGCCVINRKQADKIRRLHSTEGLSVRALGERFGIGKKQITEILRGTAWKTNEPATLAATPAPQAAAPDLERRAKAMKVDTARKNPSSITYRVCLGPCRLRRSLRQFPDDGPICANCLRRAPGA